MRVILAISRACGAWSSQEINMAPTSLVWEQQSLSKRTTQEEVSASIESGPCWPYHFLYAASNHECTKSAHCPPQTKYQRQAECSSVSWRPAPSSVIRPCSTKSIVHPPLQSQTTSLTTMRTKPYYSSQASGGLWLLSYGPQTPIIYFLMATCSSRREPGNDSRWWMLFCYQFGTPGALPKATTTTSAFPPPWLRSLWAWSCAKR